MTTLTALSILFFANSVLTYTSIKASYGPRVGLPGPGGFEFARFVLRQPEAIPTLGVALILLLAAFLPPAKWVALFSGAASVTYLLGARDRTMLKGRQD